MSPNQHYRCEDCGQEYPLDSAYWRCPACGGAFAMAGPNHLSVDDIHRSTPSLWRYAAVLPVGRATGDTLGAGMTPLVPATLAGRTVLLKLDYLLPSGSFKDRGAALLAEHFRAQAVQRVIVDSSGNAAAAMAGYCAAHDMACVVYAPAATSPGKLVQARAFGATVHLVAGNREEVAAAAQDAAEREVDAAYASHNWHPIFVEGVKTWALELWEQLGGRNPSAAFVPTGGGSAFVGAYRGFAATAAPLPVLVAAQPAACAPVAHAVERGDDFIAPVTPGASLAEGTRIGAPARGRQIISAIRETNGWAAAVTEDEIIAALRELWTQGFYVEPTAAVGAAAFRQAVAAGRDLPSGDIVVLLTGSGLKATDTIATLLES